MYDRPSAQELIQAARQHLETQLVPLTKQHSHKLYFQTLVAVNVLRIVERELALAGQHARAEWSRLDMLLGLESPPNDASARQERLLARNAALCAAIRQGAHDSNAACLAHLLACATEQLEVANPKYLAMLAAEDAQA